jgi:D-aminopeptidase
MEATEEAIVASLFAAKTTSGHLGSVEGLPVDRVLELLREAGRLNLP